MADFQDNTLAELEAFLADEDVEQPAQSSGEVDFDQMLKSALEEATDAAPEVEDNDAWLDSMLDDVELQSATAIVDQYAKVAKPDERAGLGPNQAAVSVHSPTTAMDEALEDAVAEALAAATRPHAKASSPGAKAKHLKAVPTHKGVDTPTRPVPPLALRPAPPAPESQKVQELREQVKRFGSETEKYRERMEAQAKQARSKGREDVFDRLLPIIDTLDLALKAAPNAKSIEKVVSGVEMVQKQLLSELKRLGLECIDPQDMPFDPALHEAMQKIKTGKVKSGQVVHVLRLGFSFEKKLLRAAQVVIEE